MNELAEKRTPELIGAEIRMYVTAGRQIATLCGIEIGRRLVEAKEMLPHGEWLPWLKRETGFSERSAQTYMQVFDQYGASQMGLFGPETNTQTFADLPISKAIALLSVPESDREEFAAEVDAEHISVRELKEKIKERERQVEALQADMDGERKALTDAREQIAKLAELNKELENRPRDVAIETVRDEEAIAAAAKEAREAAVKEYENTVTDLNKKLLKAEKDSAKAVEDLKKKLQDMEKALNKKENEALGAEDRSRQETEKLKGEIAAAQQELEAARKQLKVSSADVAEFGVWFKQVQADFSSLIEALGKVEKRDPETGAKLRGGVTQLLTTLSGTI